MRRIMTFVLALVLVMGLCACGSSAAPAATAAPETTAPETTAPETTAPETEEPVAEGGQFRVGMECAYAPNNWQEDAATDSNWPIENVPGAYAEGNDVQIARLIAEGLGKELVIVKLAWTGLIEALNQGQIDAIIAGMADTAERREAINFSDPYFRSEYGVMVAEDSQYASATSIHDFEGASVLGQKDTMLDTVIDQMDGVNHLAPVASVPDMIGRLTQGTCDVIIINMENAQSLIDANPGYIAIGFEDGQGFDLGFVGACIGIRKTDDQLLEDVNAVLATIDQATRDELYATAIANQPK